MRRRAAAAATPPPSRRSGRCGWRLRADHPRSRRPIRRPGRPVRIEERSQRPGAWSRELRERADIVVLVSHCGKETDERTGPRGARDRRDRGRPLPLPASLRRVHLALGRASPSDAVERHDHRAGAPVGRRAGAARPALRAGTRNGRWQVDALSRRASSRSRSELPPDPAVAAVVDATGIPIAARYGEVVGQATADFCLPRQRSGRVQPGGRRDPRDASD